MRQALRAVTLELDSLLEIHQVELDLLGAAPQGEVRYDHMEQSGFAGTGFSRDQTVLPRAFADGEILELGGARAANRHAQFGGGHPGPNGLLRRRHLRERNLDAARIAAGLADRLDELNRLLGRGRCLQRHFRSRFRIAGQKKCRSFATHEVLRQQES